VLSGLPQQLRPVLEARPIDEAGNGRRRAHRERLQRGMETLPTEAALDAARQFAASVSDFLRVRIGKKIGDQRRKPGAARRLRQRASRDRCD